MSAPTYPTPRRVGAALAPAKPGQTMQGHPITTSLTVGELVLLELLYRLAVRGAQADGRSTLAAQLERDRCDIARRIGAMAALRTCEVAGYA